MASVHSASGGPAPVDAPATGDPAVGGDGPAPAGGVASIPGVQLPCPQCGALLTPPHQVDTFRCRWCGSTLRAAEGPRVFHLVERPRLDPTQALQSLRRWFAGPETPRGLEGQAVADMGVLHLFPFVRIRGQGPDHVAPLAPLPAPDLWDLPSVPADMTEARAPVPHEHPLVRVETDGELLRDALLTASRDAAVKEVVIEERAYYPVSYRFAGERYTAAVAAGGGTVLAQRRPARSRVVEERPVAVGALALLFAEAALVPGLVAKVVVVALTAVGLYPLLRWLVATRL